MGGNSMWVAALICAAGLAGCSGGDRTSRVQPAAQATPATHANESHAHDTEPVAPPEGTLWPTDEALRAGMSRIEAALDSTTAAARPLARERADALARSVEENVTYIVRNCKLPPEPDAALHVLIGRLMTAAQQLASDASSEDALEQIAAVVRDYHGTFDHAAVVADAP